MPDPPAPAVPHEEAPTLPASRLVSLDLLRGFALLGILVINMRYFAMPMAGGALGDPNHPGDTFAPLDFWSWFGANLLFEDKMMALFSTLFGAGIWLLADRGLFLHYRRMGWLLLIGIAHATLLWFGDILTLYALCGMVVVAFRRLPPGLLVVLGLSGVFFSIGERPFLQMAEELHPVAVVAGDDTAEVVEADDETAEEADEPWWPWRAELQTRQRAEFVAHFAADTERAMHEGPWRDQVKWRATLLPWWQLAGFASHGLIWNGGLMLLGMGLMGLGYLDGSRRARSYLALGFAAMAFGLAITALGVWPQTFEPLGRDAALWDADAGPMPDGVLRLYRSAGTLRRLGAILVSFGWASLLLAAIRAGWVRAILHPVVAVGRMALTNYLTHTVVCVVIFEGWGLGRWDEVRYFEQMRLVGTILAAQLVVCPLWLLVFRFGPIEWAWRSLAYWSPQPVLRRRALQG